MDNKIESLIRLRISEHDVHYAGGLVDGAKMLQLFGDVATELLIKTDGDEGLFVAYDKVEFLAPVHAGDYIEARGEVEKMGNSSRTMSKEIVHLCRGKPASVPGNFRLAGIASHLGMAGMSRRQVVTAPKSPP